MTNRMDHHFREFEQQRERLRTQASSSVRSRRAARAAAFKMAKCFVAMETGDHNWLLGMIRGDAQYSGADGITRWLDDSFAPLGLIGTTHHELIRAVAEGMTLSKYQSTEPRAFSSAIRAAAVNAQKMDGPVPTAPDDELSAEARAHMWRVRAEAFEVRLRAERQLRRADRGRINTLEREVAALVSTVGRVA